MAGPRRNEFDATGGDPYRVQGNRLGSGVTAEAVIRLFVAKSAAYAVDEAGRVHVFDASGAVTASIDIGPFADAALHDAGSALAVAAYGKGVTSIAGVSTDGSGARFLSHGAAVLACASTPDGLVVGDQAGKVTLLVAELGAGRAAPLPLRAQILSIASAGSTLAVLTADGEVLTGAWPRHGTLSTVRGLRAKRPYRVMAQRGGFVVLDRERVHTVRGDEAVHASRELPEGLLACDPAQSGGWALTDLGRLHHLDESLRASPALALGVSGRPRGLVSIGERAAVWTTRGELVLASPDQRVRTVATEGVLAAGVDPASGDLVALHNARGLALRRHPPS